MVKPFLKWVGGKTQLLPEIRKYIPEKYDYYIEPFVGGGSVFFDLLPQKAILNDINFQLIHAYNSVKNDCPTLIKKLKDYDSLHTKEFYYDERAKYKPDDAEVLTINDAVRFIYLNKTCFNGLFRVNKHGKFNTPMGNYKKPNICDAITLIEASVKLKNVTITNDNYKQSIKQANAGDLVYCDPPYYELNKTSNFNSYTPLKFDRNDQIELSKILVNAVKRGVKVIASNSNTAFTQSLYDNEHFDIITVEARRNVNSNATKRGKINELLLVSHN
jgi:DNA adenine methylase